jgi:hypothetical protein
MAGKNTHLLAAKADGLDEELAEITINVIDLPHKMPPNFNFKDYHKELMEIRSWLNPKNLEERIRNCTSAVYLTPSQIRLHILLDIIFNYIIPYNTALRSQFKNIAEKEGFKGIWKFAKMNYETNILYGTYGEVVGINIQNLDYINIFAEILNVCNVWFYYRYKQTITLNELKSELYKWGVWAARILGKRYGYVLDANFFLDF